MSHPNPGILALADTVHYGRYQELTGIEKFKNVDFAVIGSEKAINSGAADALAASEIPVVAPVMAATKIETSKIFARDLLDRHHINGNPEFRVINNLDEFKSAQKDFRRLVI